MKEVGVVEFMKVSRRFYICWKLNGVSGGVARMTEADNKRARGTMLCNTVAQLRPRRHRDTEGRTLCSI